MTKAEEVQATKKAIENVVSKRLAQGLPVYKVQSYLNQLLGIWKSDGEIVIFIKEEINKLSYYR